MSIYNIHGGGIARLKWMSATSHDPVEFSIENTDGDYGTREVYAMA